MRVTKNERVIPVDVDSTLVFSPDPNKHIPGRTVEVYDPVTKQMLTMIVHEPMVRLVMEEKQRGAYIIVWSRGGNEWAENVIKAVGLEDYVDDVFTKAITYFDDKNVAEWMIDRVYLEPGTPYKNVHTN